MKIIINLMFVLTSLSVSGQNTNLSEVKKEKSFKYYNITSIGVLPGTEKVYSTNMFTVVNGIQFKNRLGIGIGLGIEKSSNYLNRSAPMYLEGRFSFSKKANSPFVSLMTGYNMSLSNQPKRNNYGISTGVSLGINIFANEHLGISTSIGYRYTYMECKPNYNYYYYGCVIGEYYKQTKLDINRIELKVGFIIK